jgi:hypothetical protein
MDFTWRLAESSSYNFCHIYCSADGFAARFYADFFGTAVEECDASKDVIHDWLFPINTHCFQTSLFANS